MTSARVTLANCALSFVVLLFSIPHGFMKPGRSLVNLDQVKLLSSVKKLFWLSGHSCALPAGRVGRTAEASGAQESVCDEQPRSEAQKKGLRCCVKESQALFKRRRKLGLREGVLGTDGLRSNLVDPVGMFFASVTSTIRCR